MQIKRRLRTVEQRRADARVIMLFEIVYGLVAISLPLYFEQPTRNSRHSHPFILRQIQTMVIYFRYYFSYIGMDYLFQWLHPCFDSTTDLFFLVFNFCTFFLNPILFYSSFSVSSIYISIVVLRRNLPTHNPCEGILQY